jgi:hypothetical protein
MLLVAGTILLVAALAAGIRLALGGRPGGAANPGLDVVRYPAANPPPPGGAAATAERPRPDRRPAQE